MFQTKLISIFQVALFFSITPLFVFQKSERDRDNRKFLDTKIDTVVNYQGNYHDI